VSALKTRDIRSALLRKGFRRDNTHHEYLWLYVGGKITTVKTYLSHGRSEYGEDLLAKVKQQLGISKQQLFDLVHCRLEYTPYVVHLVKSGRINIIE